VKSKIHFANQGIRVEYKRVPSVVSLRVIGALLPLSNVCRGYLLESIQRAENTRQRCIHHNFSERISCATYFSTAVSKI